MNKIIIGLISLVFISCVCNSVKDSVRTAIDDMFLYTNSTSFTYTIRMNVTGKNPEVYFKYKDKLNVNCGLTIDKQDLQCISNAQNTLFVNEFISKLNKYTNK